VVEGEEAWEVGQVGDEGGPDWRLTMVSIKQASWSDVDGDLPLSESTGRSEADILAGGRAWTCWTA
jgi:hypothetical protein